MAEPGHSDDAGMQGARLVTDTGRLEHAPSLEDLRKLLQDELSRSKSYEQNEIETARIVAEHWQHTNDRMTEYWKERNRLFIYALVVITIALLLSTTVEGINIIVFYVTSYLDKLTGAENSASASSLISTALIRSIIPVPVFYLVLNIFQRDLYLRRNYLYLQSLERVIRDRLALHDSEAFTRESAFYRDKETFAQRKVLSFYHIILFAIVTLFFAYRLAIDFELARNDLALGNVIVLLVDIGMAGSTIFFLAGYICADHSFADARENCKITEKRCMLKCISLAMSFVLIGAVAVYLN